ncbi:MAG TPA: CHAT domain-containing protein [Thermoanaerobaculia bacterium]|nr:CHAT domain-containing protein [Thermoanaerobaculia bacterium]
MDPIADRALIKLIDGRPRDAAADFEKAAAMSPTRADVFSDLSATYLDLARREDDPSSLVKALESAEKAAAIDPALPEARFNRALALEHLFLAGQASRAWREYQSLEPNSPWSSEASDHLRALGGPAAEARWMADRRRIDDAVEQGDHGTVLRLVRVHPQAAREYAEEALLGNWGGELQAHRPEEARRTLAIARALGAALREINGERMVADSVSEIDQVGETQSARLSSLITGHELYGRGLRLYQDGRFTEALQQFENARARLAASPFAAWASFRVAVCEMQRFHYERALAILGHLPPKAEGFHSLEGRARWVAGLIHGIQARPAESLALYRSAARAFTSIHETENVVVVQALAAEGLKDLGDLVAAWHSLSAALGGVTELRVAVRRQVVLEQAGIAAVRAGAPLAALSFFQEALDSSAAVQNVASWFYCLRSKALTFGRLGRWAEAEATLTKARVELDRFPDKSIRRSFVGDILATESQILESRDPRGSVASLSSAIGIYQHTEYQQQLAFLYAQRARSYLALAKLDLAEADFGRAILAIRNQRQAVPDESLRASYLEEFRSIFDDMVALQVRLGHPDVALDFAELARAQVLREMAAAAVSGTAGEPLKSADIRRRLPPGVALIELAVTGHQLLTWVIQRDSLNVYQSEISTDSLRSSVRRFRRLILGNPAGDGVGQASRELYTVLLGRIAPSLAGVTTLVLVPDRDLWTLPFAALQEPATGKRLVELYSLAMAPSANLYVQALERAMKTSAKSPRVLVIGGPEVDRALLPDLPSLPYAASESRSIAGLYPGAQLLLGGAAGRDRFLDGLDRFDIVHFAGHAVASPEPSWSFLALSPAGHNSGILYARELYGRKSVRARLVVLSACSGFAGGTETSEGANSLARPFLAAGVPGVVGSLWRADDRATEALLVAFHRHLGSGLSAAEALRRAQIEMLSSVHESFSAPAAWAGFQLLGA